MSVKHYNWEDGPDLIQQHSVAKHKILQSYLAAYFKTLVSSPNQDELRLTIVDGFAGGGQYYHQDTNEVVMGSPFVCLNATKEADFELNRNRRKPLKLDVNYFFIESNKHAYQHLDKVLRDEGYAACLNQNIHLKHGKFQNHVSDIIDFIKNKSPRNGRSIFILDQYGYKEVPTLLIQNIFAKLPSAEVILTFGIDSFINFASDKNLTKELLDEVGISDILDGKSIEEIKSSERNWRYFLQSTLYRSLVTKCGAEFFTPFFVRNNSGHGDYWLIHMSQHFKARDVMTQVHWDNHNHFIHYGGSGLNMFQMVGYDPDYDADFLNQSKLGFEFDDVAKNLSISALREQIPRLIYANEDGMTFGELFAKTCNGSPASASIYQETIHQILQEKIVEVTGVAGENRRSALQIKNNDQITPSNQRKLFGF